VGQASGTCADHAVDELDPAKYRLKWVPAGPRSQPLWSPVTPL
jgi:hypothetical protein